MRIRASPCHRQRGWHKTNPDPIHPRRDQARLAIPEPIPVARTTESRGLLPFMSVVQMGNSSSLPYVAARSAVPRTSRKAQRKSIMKVHLEDTMLTWILDFALVAPRPLPNKEPFPLLSPSPGRCLRKLMKLTPQSTWMSGLPVTSADSAMSIDRQSIAELPTLVPRRSKKSKPVP